MELARGGKMGLRRERARGLGLLLEELQAITRNFRRVFAYKYA